MLELLLLIHQKISGAVASDVVGASQCGTVDAESFLLHNWTSSLSPMSAKTRMCWYLRQASELLMSIDSSSTSAIILPSHSCA